MAFDTLSDAVQAALDAVKAAIPSQAPDVSVCGVRKTADGTRTFRGVLKSCVLSDGFADPLGEMSIQSNALSVSLLIPMSPVHGGWFDVTPPQAGDELMIEDRRYTVVSVAQSRNLYYRLGAKQC